MCDLIGKILLMVFIPFTFVALIIPFIYLDIIIDCILKGLDAQVSVMFINIVDLLVSISVIMIFVPWFGIRGYVVSIFISEILNFILSFWKLEELIKR